MDILEPASVDANGHEREDVMQANDPVDLFLLPGHAFDRSGRRMGRGGGYYDTFLRKYLELAKERNLRQPLFVALSYSLQILDDEIIPLTPNDVPVDALVSASGIIPITPAALDRRKTLISNIEIKGKCHLQQIPQEIVICLACNSCQENNMACHFFEAMVG